MTLVVIVIYFKNFNFVKSFWAGEVMLKEQHEVQNILGNNPCHSLTEKQTTKS